MKRSFLLPILTVAAVLAGMVTHNIVSAQFSQEELLGCVEFGLHNQACNALDKFHDEFDYRTNGIPSASQTVSNEDLTITLNFMGEIPLPEGGTGAWTEAAQQPYVDVAEQWLEIISGIQNVDQHHLKINFAVMDVGEDSLGLADLDFERLCVYGPYVIPTQGYIAVDDIFYDAADSILEFEAKNAVEEELKANIAHEIGHVLGIGTLWNIDVLRPGQFDASETEYAGSYRNWSIASPFDDGVIYRKPNSAAIARYNEAFETDYDFLPINYGHLYNIGEQQEQFGGNGKRFDPDGRKIPEMSWELMGHGMVLSPITIGLLEDLGWAVNYNAVEGACSRRRRGCLWSEHWHRANECFDDLISSR